MVRGTSSDGRVADDYDVTYSIDKAEYRRLDGEIETRMEITVVPDQDVEVRRITLMNLGSKPRMLDVTSYAEIVLAPHAADTAHPAFGKLFLETEWLRESSTILVKRRPRSATQQPVFAIHSLTTDAPGTLSFETSREVFLGRRRSVVSPQSLDGSITNLSNTVGAVLDPIVAIRRSVLLKPGERAVIAYTTGVAATHEEAVALPWRNTARWPPSLMHSNCPGRMPASNSRAVIGSPTTFIFSATRRASPLLRGPVAGCR